MLNVNLHHAYNLGLAGGLVTLLFHATFVNSLLFPHILVFFWISSLEIGAENHILCRFGPICGVNFFHEYPAFNRLCSPA